MIDHPGPTGRAPRRNTLRLLVAVGALLLAGCGGDDEATAQVPATFFGVLPQELPNRADIARMGQGGVGTYRLLVNWRRVEGRDGRYRWEHYDRIVAELARNGIQPLPYVFGTPPWFGRKATNPPTRSEDALRGWEDFLRAAAHRYGPSGQFWMLFGLLNPGVEPRPFRVWEIWNEQNAPAFWDPQPNPRAYGRLLAASARAIRSADPDGEIMVGGMFATPRHERGINSFRFLRQLFRQPGVPEAVDIVGAHPYAPDMRGVRFQLRRTRQVMRRAGLADRDLWVTEFGWGTRPRSQRPRRNQAQLMKPPRQQALLLRRAFRMLIRNRERWNVRGGVWYTWRDPDGPLGHNPACQWCLTAGLLQRDRTPKPAWRAFTGLTSRLSE